MQARELQPEYFFTVESHEYSLDWLDGYFGGMKLAEGSNVYTLTEIREDGGNYYARFHQGFWDREAGTYEETSGLVSAELNVT